MAIFLMGGVFCWLLGRGYLVAASYDDWVETPATISGSWVERVPQPEGATPRYAFRARYEYQVAGERYRSSQVREIERRLKNREKVESVQRRYPVDGEVTCYVNPGNPGEAILIRPTKAPGYSIWFPGLFVVGGVGMCVRALRRNHR